MSEESRNLPTPAAKIEAYTLAANTYRGQLGAEATEYLHGRGFDDQTIARFGLGFVAEPLPGDESLAGRVSIPFIGPRKNVYGIKYRAIKDGHRPKYDGPSGQRTRLFNTRALYEADDLIVVAEGELDCITLNMIGVPAVGVPGASNWPGFYHRIFADFHRVIFTGDADDSGEGKRWARKAAGSVFAGEVRMMPDGHDVNSLFCSEGREAVLAALHIG